MSRTMVRKQSYIPRRQDVLSKRLSETRGSEAEVIRQAIDWEISSELSTSMPDSRSALDLVLELDWL